MFERFYRVSRRFLGPWQSCSRFVLDFGWFPTPVLALRWSDLFLNLFLHSRPDPGPDLDLLPSPDQKRAPGSSSRSDPVQDGLCPCLASMSAPDRNVPLCLQQSSRPGLGIGFCLESRLQGLHPCWSSSSGPRAGTGPCSPPGLQTNYPLSPVVEEASRWAEPRNQDPIHWPAHLMTSQNSWWSDNLRFPWKHSEGPRTWDEKY